MINFVNFYVSYFLLSSILEETEEIFRDSTETTHEEIDSVRNNTHQRMNNLQPLATTSRLIAV